MVPEQVMAVLQRVGPVLAAHRFYLAGGTALALQLGHRESADLDFFREHAFDPEHVAADLHVGTVALAERGTLRLWLGDVKVECFHYPYPLLAPLRPVPGMPGVLLADTLDIGLMKLAAIGQRGAKKDFIDLYAICRQVYPLAELLRLAPRKFGSRFEHMHYLKSLTYFDDAEAEPDPAGWGGGRWEQVKAFFRGEARRLVAADLEGPEPER